MLVLLEVRQASTKATANRNVFHAASGVRTEWCQSYRHFLRSSLSKIIMITSGEFICIHACCLLACILGSRALGSPDSLFRVASHDKVGFVDSTGRVAVSFKYEAASDFSDGTAAVKLNGKWGFINSSEIFVVEPAFQKLRAFSEGKAAACVDEMIGLAILIQT